MTFSRLAALKIAARARTRLGVPLHIASYIAFAARKYRVRWSLAFALFEQESNYKVIYGHDSGGLLPGQRVTKDNYRYFRGRVVSTKGRGANGVGLGQVTYWTYISEYRDLYKPRVQVYLALSILAENLFAYGERNGIGAYNGGPTTPNLTYADEVLAKARAIRPKLGNP